MAEDKDYWSSTNDYWSEDYQEPDGLKEQDVIIDNETPESDGSSEDDDELFYSLMNPEEPDEVEQRFKQDPLMSAWVPDKPTPKVNVTENARYAYDYFNQRGLPQHVSAGIVGNLMKESGLNPKIRDGDKRGGIGGIAQWDPARSNNLRAFAERQGRSATELNTQLDFVLHEAQQRGDLEKTKQARTPEEAAVLFGRSYERPSEAAADWGTRQAYARSLTKQQYAGSVNNVPDDLGGVSDEAIEQYLEENLSSQDSMKLFDANEPEEKGKTALTAINGANKALDIVDKGRSRLSQIADTASRSVSDAIDFQVEMAGAQRNVASMRKFRKEKNTVKFAPMRTTQNQPLIYD